MLTALCLQKQLRGHMKCCSIYFSHAHDQAGWILETFVFDPCLPPAYQQSPEAQL